MPILVDLYKKPSIVYIMGVKLWFSMNDCAFLDLPTSLKLEGLLAHISMS